ncbi:MAG TPA: hypothetical protein VGA98_06655 [Allosphingosinicella sp.]
MAIDVVREREEALKCIARISTAAARARLTSELDDLVARYEKAQSAEQVELATRIMQLKRDAEIAASVNLWSRWSIALVMLVVALYFGGIFAYMAGLGSERYASIEATRPILVFTLIVAMLSFGGLLIIRALFSSEGDEAFQNRFRHAREIFLVFAGIFGTIIGFYFGAADKDSAADIPSVEVTAAAGRRIEATVEGGHAPFTATLTLPNNGGSVPMSGEGRSLSTILTAAQCPAEATLVLFDARSRRSEDKIDLDAAALQRLGWDCPVSPGGGGDNVTANEAAGDAADPANAAATG